MTADSLQIQEHLTDDAAYSTRLQREEVEVTPTPNAAVCGCLGCRQVEYLVRVTIDGFGTRVTCPSHAARLLKREVEDV